MAAYLIVDTLQVLDSNNPDSKVIIINIVTQTQSRSTELNALHTYTLPLCEQHTPAASELLQLEARKCPQYYR